MSFDFPGETQVDLIALMFQFSVPVTVSECCSTQKRDNRPALRREGMPGTGYMLYGIQSFGMFNMFSGLSDYLQKTG